MWKTLWEIQDTERFFHTTRGMIITETCIEKRLMPDSLGFFILDEPQMSFTEWVIKYM